jgi:ankyrin repeat protein
VENNPGTAGLLLEFGADIHSRNCYGYQPMHNAMFYGNCEVAQLLVARGASLTDDRNFGDINPFQVADNQEEHEAKKIVQGLVARLDLFRAACAGNVGDVKSLLEQQGEQAGREKLGEANELCHSYTPLLVAAARGRLAVVEALLDESASLVARDDR